MCRLYGFISTFPRKVECELIESQNSLLAQSRKDQRGMSNQDGWGLGEYENDQPIVIKQASFAQDSEVFRWAAAQSYSNHIMSHVRRATVGQISPENTHPFVQDNLMLAHNGHIENFDYVKEKILCQLSDTEHFLIKGSTDSEHILGLVHHYYYLGGVNLLYMALHKAIKQINTWSLSVDSSKKSAYNILLTNGKSLVASRYQRTMYYTLRKSVHSCEICTGAPLHVQGEVPSKYQAVVIASEVITSNETWCEVPDNSVLWIDQKVGMHFSEHPLIN